LIDSAYQAIRSTRKSNRIADSVWLSQLEKWEHYHADQVETGIQTYLEKDYASQGKDEKYLYGIITKTKLPTAKPSTTGSTLLDSYYANAN